MTRRNDPAARTVATVFRGERGGLTPETLTFLRWLRSHEFGGVADAIERDDVPEALRLGLPAAFREYRAAV